MAPRTSGVLATWTGQHEGWANMQGNTKNVKQMQSLSNSKRIKSQQRRDAWFNSKASVAQKRRYRAFLKGWNTGRGRYTVEDGDITNTISRGTQNQEPHHYLHHTSHLPSARESDHATTIEQREMTTLLGLLQEGGAGYMPKRKASGWVRLMFENWNSLGVFTHKWKIDRLNHMIQNLQVDVVAGCETQCDWSFGNTQQQFLNLLCPGQSVKGIASHNRNERIHREQTGGTAIAAVGRISDIVSKVGCDPTGLGRWSWVKLGMGPKSTRVICGYLPCKPSKTSRGRTVWEQHSRYFQAKGDFRYPSTIFIEDILQHIKEWRTAGEEVVLMIDANQDVYDGLLARSLAATGVYMNCLMEAPLGEKVPNSHFRGTAKITTIFGSPGLVQGHAMCYPHWYGVGDHRVFVLEISAASLFGGDFPTIAPPKSRQLNCKITRIRKKYCHCLHALVTRHSTFKKLNHLSHTAEGTHSEHALHLHDRWDEELGDFMRSAERHCNKFKSCAIEYSPTVGQWLRRRSVLKWLLRWKDGKVHDTRNLLRAAKRAQINNPLELSTTDIESRLHACLQELFKLKQQAPDLRRKHLQWRLNLARQRGDEEAQREITRISRNEAQRQKQRNINRVVRDPRGRSVLSVKVSMPAGQPERVLTTQEEVEQACGEHLGNRFSLGRRAPLSADHLLTEIGPLCDTVAAQKILNNTYTFSDNWDPTTVDLLKAAARLRLELEDIPPTEHDITAEEFTSFWATCKESTSSSKSGRHFGHYRAISHDPALVELHIRNINLAASRGQPLTRWRQGVTVLLEKVAGNNNLEKLRAICLLEADFNWWLKVTFAKRMMHRMRMNSIMPIEQGAVSGKTTADSAMLKQLFLDQANILHETCAISSNDAANCYDAVNHAAGSFALQAMKVPLTFVKCYLLCIQTMQFFLRTGFGLARQSYGGTSTNPYMGLTQGSGASPAAWSAISTVILDAYKSKGFGAYFASSWSGLIFVVAALLYVDDTDLLHMCQDTRLSEEAFVKRVQDATHYWAKLLQATGGNLKPEKCYWYLLRYKFTNGIAKLKTRSELSQHKLYIPQPLATDVEITMKDSSTASEVLGVWSSPSGTDNMHLRHMLRKGYKWSMRVMHSTLTPSEVWHSFRTQALPSVQYGLLTLMTPRAHLDDSFMKWYQSFLPALGLNRNIKKQWRTLPVRYQGLGLPQMSLEKLAISLHYIQRHWDRSTVYGQALRSLFELVQIEVGLEGNFLQREYRKYNRLATHSWFRVLWELIDYYQVTLHLSNVSVPPVRQRDQVLMEMVIKLTPPAMWTPFNRVRKFHKVYFLSQLIHCDGSTVDITKLGDTTLTSSVMRYPLEQPSRTDFKVWRDTIILLTSPKLRLSPRLGKHVRVPYESPYWMSNDARDYLLRIQPGQPTEIFKPQQNHYNTRQRKCYQRMSDTTRTTTGSHIVSVQGGDRDVVTVQSQSLLQILPLREKTNSSFLYSLLDVGGSSAWKNIQVEGLGDWLLQSYSKGTLMTCHDGSYMPEMDDTRCSAAVIFLCTHTGRLAHVSYCEYTDHYTASNYRGELIGGVLATLVLQALDMQVDVKPIEVSPVYCDNMGVVLHGTNTTRSLPEKQAHQDLLYIFRSNIQKVANRIQYVHVYGHMDNNTTLSALSLQQQLNVLADRLAKDTLLHGITAKVTSGPNYPGERVRILINGRKTTSSIRSALYHSWGSMLAKQLFQQRCIVSTYNFNLIAWDNVQRVMMAYPQMFRTWLTKQVSGFCGNNRLLSRIDSSVINVCPCCGHQDDSTSHLTRCTNPGRRQQFRLSADLLLDWMESTYGDRGLINCLDEYLDTRGEGNMTKIAKPYPYLGQWAHEHDILGWDNFMEGRISSKLLGIQKQQLLRRGSRMTIQAWAQTFTQHVLNITHNQWVYRNMRVHLRLHDNKTEDEHHDISEDICKMLTVNTMDLLPQHRQLLDIDFEQLGRGDTTDRQYWLANMSSAMHAALAIANHSSTARNHHNGSTTRQVKDT